MRHSQVFRESVLFWALGVGIALSALGLLLLPAAAQENEPRVDGVIVSVRADVIQVRPQYSTQLVRVLVDEKTVVQKPELVGLDKLRTGMRLFGFGDADGPNGVKGRFMQVVEGDTRGFFRGPRGRRGTGYGNSVMFAGTVKSLQPLVLTDDDGKEIPVATGPFLPIMRRVKSGTEALLVGQGIHAEGKRTVDGLLQAETVEIQPFGGSGGGGTVFGKITAASGGSFQVRPRFAETPMTVTLAENVVLQRQITLDPDTIKLGDTITAQGKLTEGTTEAPKAMVAAVLLTGRQSYPKARAGGFFAMFRGGDGQEVTCTGKVSSLSPFALTLENGTPVAVTIPGQVPVVDLRSATAADLKPGEKVAVIGSEGKEGGMTANTVIIGGSSIVGFGG